LKKDSSVLIFPIKKSKGKFREQSIALDSFKGTQESSLKEKRQSLIKRKSSLPTTGHSTGGGEGPSAAEVATSFPARLLGAIGKRTAKEVLGFLNDERRRRKRVKVL